MNTRERHTQFIKSLSRELGFLSCGISKADFLEDEAPRLEAFLEMGAQGQMGYLERNFDKRLDPRLLVPGARSVVSLLYNYYSPERPEMNDSLRISSYAYGTDYHLVVKDKLKELLNTINREIGEVSGRMFVDSAPVLEKAWAARSGLGWVGKHTNLISKKVGSYFFLAELIIDLDLVPDAPVTDHCGSCTRCIDACPTGAIIQPYVVDGSKCISYFTIELKDELLPVEWKGKWDDWIFGCDVCQEVCPWNRFSTPHNEPAFEPRAELLEMSRSDWENLTEEAFRRLFKDSPVKRTGYKGLMRNINFLSSD
ncbi:MAG: tRNA epoxyqueuosine(34) reductase QueG [Flavobacteriales bacterium]|nr:tRNA epoxyqueuosine(34) reductase QueG [Flavobacteriales bacterium]